MFKLLKFFAPESATAAGAAPTETPAAAVESEVETPQYINEDQIPTDGPERVEWQRTGKLLAKKSLSEKPASTTGTEDDADDEEEETAAPEASPASKTSPDASKQPEHAQEKPTELKPKTANRVERLLSLLEQKEAQIQELTKPKTTVEKPGSQPTAAAEIPEPTMDDKDANGKFKYTKIEDYNRAHAAWSEDRTIQKLEKRQREQETTRMSEAQARETTDKWRNRIEKAREKHADFDKVAMAETLMIPAGSPMEAAIVLSEHGPEMNYLLGKHPEEAARISKLHPFEQAREMFLLELLAGGWDTTVGKDPRFSPRLSSSVKTLKLPPAPPHEVGSGRGTPPGDALETAAKEDDFGSYAAAANARDVARLRKRKGK